MTAGERVAGPDALYRVFLGHTVACAVCRGGPPPLSEGRGAGTYVA